ncbi:hypothetical protein L9G15_23435, partial [Shewanella sp. A3A]|nr:hypothetical protein [Shewanella ferrihydritica]
PYAARRQIREDVIGKLVRETPATANAYPWFWNLDDGRLYLSSLSKAVHDEFVELFEQTFGCTLECMDILRIGQHQGGEAIRADMEEPEP